MANINIYEAVGSSWELFLISDCVGAPLSKNWESLQIRK